MQILLPVIDGIFSFSFVMQENGSQRGNFSLLKASFLSYKIMSVIPTFMAFKVRSFHTGRFFNKKKYIDDMKKDSLNKAPMQQLTLNEFYNSLSNAEKATFRAMFEKQVATIRSFTNWKKKKPASISALARLQELVRYFRRDVIIIYPEDNPHDCDISDTDKN